MYKTKRNESQNISHTSYSICRFVSLSLYLSLYIYIIIIIKLSSGPIVFRSWLVLWSSSGVRTELICVSSCSTANTSVSMRRNSIKERRLWIHTCFSSTALHVLFVLLKWFVRWEVSGFTAAVSWDVVSKQQVVFLGSSLLAFPHKRFVRVHMVHRKSLQIKVFYGGIHFSGKHR